MGAPYPQQPQDPYAQPYPNGGPGHPNAMPQQRSRPGMVTAAAVIAFVVGGFSLIGGIGLIGLSSLVYANTGLLTVLGILTIVIAALYIWGGVSALTGKDGRILVIASGLSIVLNLVTAFNNTFNASSLSGMILPILILAFVLQAPCREYFRSRGGSTF